MVGSKSKRRDAAAIFGRQVRLARSEIGWSTQRLADEVGVNRSDVVKIESGARRRFTFDEVFAYAAALRRPPIDLLFPEDEHEAIEILGKTRSARIARDWFLGLGQLRGRAPARKTYPFRAIPRTMLHAFVDAAVTKPGQRLAIAAADAWPEHEEYIGQLVDLLRNLPTEAKEEGDG